LKIERTKLMMGKKRMKSEVRLMFGLVTDLRFERSLANDEELKLRESGNKTEELKKSFFGY